MIELKNCLPPSKLIIFMLWRLESSQLIFLSCLIVTSLNVRQVRLEVQPWSSKITLSVIFLVTWILFKWAVWRWLLKMSSTSGDKDTPTRRLSSFLIISLVVITSAFSYVATLLVLSSVLFSKALQMGYTFSTKCKFCQKNHL